MIRTYCDSCEKQSTLKEIEIYGDFHDFRMSKFFCNDCYKEKKHSISKILGEKK